VVDPLLMLALNSGRSDCSNGSRWSPLCVRTPRVVPVNRTQH